MKIDEAGHDGETGRVDHLRALRRRAEAAKHGLDDHAAGDEQIAGPVEPARRVDEPSAAEEEWGVHSPRSPEASR